MLTQFSFHSIVSSVWPHLFVQHLVEWIQPGFDVVSLHDLFVIEVRSCCSLLNFCLFLLFNQWFLCFIVADLKCLEMFASLDIKKGKSVIGWLEVSTAESLSAITRILWSLCVCYWVTLYPVRGDSAGGSCAIPWNSGVWKAVLTCLVCWAQEMLKELNISALPEVVLKCLTVKLKCWGK